MKRFYTPEQKHMIFLDMNQTLLDPQQSFELAFVDTLQEFTGRWETGEKWSLDDILARYKEEWKRRSHHLPKQKAVSPDRLREQCLSAAFDPLPLPLSAGMLKNFFQSVRERQEQNPQACADVKQTLEKLAGHYRFAIISNGSKERQEKYVKLLGLDGLIPTERLFTFQKGGLRKPQPAIFVHALQSSGIPASRGVMVGNSWKNDVLGAVGAGMDAVWIHPAHAKKSSSRKVGSLKIVIIRRFNQLTEIFHIP